MKKGFTLVELAIVLVIIGILIGGILVGQSMIETAKVHGEIKQLQQMDTAIVSFETKYHYLPGDSPLHSPPGDGDGILENSELNTGAFANTARKFDNETANFWPHLQQDGFLSTEYPTFSNVATSGIRAGINVPEDKYGSKKTGIVVDYDSSTVAYPNPPIPTYYYANFEKTTNSDHQTSVANISGSIPVGVIAAIDFKIDDGIAHPSSWALYSAGDVTTSGYSTSCFINSGNYHKYNMTGGGKCMMFISIKQTTFHNQ